MRAQDLDLRELLELPPNGGIIRFAGQRALVLDTVALGLLRTELIETIGLTAARGVLTRFGYGHGWRTADMMKSGFPWDSDIEWRRAGGRLHMLQGLVNFEPVARGRDEPDEPFAEAVWHDSYEAEQHLLFYGRADEPVCWTLTGFASGYLSRVNEREIICAEERCAGRGDSVCRMVGRTKDQWGDAPFLAWFEKGCLESALARTADELKRTERRLRTKQKAMKEAALVEAPSGIVARSEGMKRIVEVGRRVAKVDSTVLIMGESGAGKEVMARFIHEESPRVAGPFVAVNCGAVPEGLLESELFGHARGAFTGATQDRAGLFEAAQGGTLFLDEIGDVAPLMQVKLLRALQERQVRRVGENKNRAVDVRVVAATNKDLVQEVASGRFRQDLYYRLRVIELRVPPLRDRAEDILPLARLLLAEAARRTGRKIQGYTPAAANQLLRYSWPGNVRELENAIERAVALAEESTIDVHDLPEEVRLAISPPSPAGRVRSLEDVEREYILAVLEATGGNRTRAAEELSIGPATLYRKLKKYKEARPR